MKESDNTKNLGSIVIPKTRGVPQSLFRVSTLKETEDIIVSLHCIGRVVHYRFFSRSFTFAGPLWTQERFVEDKTYPAMDVLVHGEFDGVSFILVEDCIRML